MKQAILCIVAISALICGCSSRDRHAMTTTAPATPDGHVVSIDNFSFTPETLVVPVGAKVTWTNHDDVPHTVTASNKQYNSGALDTDEKFTRAFAAAGEYDYFCAIHPHMTGKIIVK
jgi:plastocyanin